MVRTNVAVTGTVSYLALLSCSCVAPFFSLYLLHLYLFHVMRYVSCDLTNTRHVVNWLLPMFRLGANLLKLPPHVLGNRAGRSNQQESSIFNKPIGCFCRP